MSLFPSPARAEKFKHGDFSVEMMLPASPEDLIDVSDFNVDERLPYWADLWPSARALAAFLLDTRRPAVRAIELGCGVGLPSLVLKHRGIDVLATDWYEEALQFAELNAERNGLAPLPTMRLDWRKIPAIAKGRFDLIVAADVLYEERNVEALVKAMDALAAPRAEVLVADPGRAYLAAFLKAVQGRWQVDAPVQMSEDAQVAGGHPVTIGIHRLQRMVGGSRA